MNETQVCKVCEKDIPRTAEYFYPLTYKRNTGEEVLTYRKTCRKCLAPYMKDKSREQRLKRKEANMLHQSKARAKKRGLEFNLDVSDIIIPEVCPLLDIPLYMAEGVISDNSPSLDRIDSSKGYIKGNVWVISARANAIKSNATSDEILQIGYRLRDRVYDI